MAGTVPSNLLSTFDIGFFPSAGGTHHEDLMDIVTILDSFQTPFFSSAPKIRARDVVHSWVVDTLAATATAGTGEGLTFSGDAITAPVRLMNGTQIFRKDIDVSDRERAANPAGIRDMFEHQVSKGFKELARNFETAVFDAGTSASATATETTSPRMAGFRGLGITTASSASGGVTTADIVSLSETLYSNGAEPDSIWFGPPSKRQFFNAIVTSANGVINYRNIAATDNRLVANVDVFESPFGQLYTVITDRFIRVTTSSAVGAYFIGDRSQAKVAFFRPPQFKEMGKNGDSTRGMVLMEPTLHIDHPSSWAAMTGVTNG